MQVVSILGAVAILAAFAADQLGWVSPDRLSYQVLNFAGAGVLAVIAIVQVQYGFILLQGAWALVSLWKIITLLRGGTSHSSR